MSAICFGVVLLPAVIWERASASDEKLPTVKTMTAIAAVLAMATRSDMAAYFHRPRLRRIRCRLTMLMASKAIVLSTMPGTSQFPCRPNAIKCAAAKDRAQTRKSSIVSTTQKLRPS